MTDSENARTGELHAGGGGWEWEGEERELERARVVYRLYATLYFVFVVDGAESELGVLDLIQVSLCGVGTGWTQYWLSWSILAMS